MTSASKSPVRWRKSSYSTNGGNCIEVGAGITGVVPVRDSKNPHGPALGFPVSSFTTFVTGLKTGKFGPA
ncbi:DUF397 domain-containing protein [Streptomyces sp. NPDC093085]|uniref:DUF397 domain-containing protein n=1 Tax=Streptomyces sp. NPDC093085 TaxID=3155068 RepID=UPI00343E0F11